MTRPFLSSEMTAEQNRSPRMNRIVFLLIVVASLMTGSMLERFASERRPSTGKLIDGSKMMKDSGTTSSDSEHGGALLMPENHSAEFSLSMPTDPSAFYRTKEPLPETSVPKIDNVLLMGQFNWDIGPTLVRHWVRRWSAFFSHIEVRGSFSNSTLYALQKQGISAFFGGSDHGSYSNMQNVGGSVRRAAQMSGIVGVMYIHDDMMVNMRGLVEQGFPWDSQAAFSGPRHFFDTRYFSVTKDGKIFSELFNTNLTDVSDALNTTAFNGWLWRYVLPGASELAKDGRFSPYFEENGTFSFMTGRSDFAYVPTQFASFFCPLADLMSEKKIWLEAAFPTLMLATAKKFNTVLLDLRLCQNTKSPEYQYGEWIPECFNASAPLYHEREGHRTTPVDLFHPIKMSGNVEIWDRCFDRIVLWQENVDIPLRQHQPSLDQIFGLN